MTKNPIIEARLNQLITKKTALLKLKKAERGNQLKSINQMINRLKSWIQDPETLIPDTEKEKRIYIIGRNPVEHSIAVEALKKVFADLGAPSFITGGHTEKERQEIQDTIIWDDCIENQDHSVDAVSYWCQSIQKTMNLDRKKGDSTSKGLQLVPNELRNRIGSWKQAFEKRN